MTRTRDPVRPGHAMRATPRTRPCPLLLLLIGLWLSALPAAHAGGARAAPPATLKEGAARLRIAQQGEDPLAESRAARALAQLQMTQGRHRDARGTLQLAYDAAERAEDEEAAVAALVGLGYACEGLGETGDAALYLSQALARAGEHDLASWRAASLAALGVVYSRTGNDEEALSFLERARASHAKQHDVAGEAACLANLGMVHLSRGRAGPALDVLERALSLQEAAGDDASVCRTLVKLADAQARLGAHETARRNLARARDICRRLDLPGDASVVLEAEAADAWRLGDAARALGALDAAQTLIEELGDRRRQASVLRHTADLLLDLGRSEEARRRLERALDLSNAAGDVAGACAALRQSAALAAQAKQRERALATLRTCLRRARRIQDAAEAMLAHGALGNLELQGGHLTEAQEHYEQALAQARLRGDHTQEAVTLGNLGELWRAKGDLERALRTQREALRVAAAEGRTRTVLLCRWGLARTLLDRGRAREALHEAQAAQAVLATRLAGLDETLGPDAQEVWHGLQEIGVLAALRLGDAGTLFDLMEAGRARALLAALAAGHVAPRQRVPEALLLEEARARAREEQAADAMARARRLRSLKRMRAQRGLLTEAQAELADVRVRIARLRTPAGGVHTAPPATWETCRKALREDEAAVLYAEAGTRALAIVLTRAGPRLVDLGQTAPLHKLTRPGIEARLAEPTILSALRRTLIGALALPGGVRHLIVSPQAELWSVPFALLAPQLDVTHAPSLTTYMRLRAQPDCGGREVLALGDPLYDARSARGMGSPRPLEPLGATRSEVQAIGSVRLLGAEATRSRLAAALAQRTAWRAVHLACHGRADTHHPLRSALALTPEGTGDGILRVLDVLAMHVPSDLVVLSGCETGRGRIYRAEGVVGLARAFLCAGAKRVLCSLWRVDDEAARALMIRFHELWNPAQGAGVDPAEALRRAQAHVRRHPRWKDPRYWAGWTLWGPAAD